MDESHIDDNSDINEEELSEEYLSIYRDRMNQDPYMVQDSYFVSDNQLSGRVRMLLFFLLLIMLLLTPLGLWWIAPSSQWRVRVVDHTVPHSNHREHYGLFWTLNFMKVPPPAGKGIWEQHRDYIGYYPLGVHRRGQKQTLRRLQSCGIRLRRQDLFGANLLFVADAYGVYKRDYQEDVYREVQPKNSGLSLKTGAYLKFYKRPENFLAGLDYSPRIFGGFNEREAKMIEEFSKGGGVVVGEFNTFASPTGGRARKRLERLFGLKWTQWVGRYFEDLADKKDVPEWARRHWRWHYNEEWNFEGPGYLFSNEDTRIFVLFPGKDIYGPGINIQIRQGYRKHPMMRGIKDNMPFLYWFDVNIAQPGTEVSAKYQVHLTESGRRKMSKFKVPPSFPAMTFRDLSSQPKIYFAGDISDISERHLNREPYYIAGWPTLRRLFNRDLQKHDYVTYFWNFYVPVMRNIFRGDVIRVPEKVNFPLEDKQTLVPLAPTSKSVTPLIPAVDPNNPEDIQKLDRQKKDKLFRPYVRQKLESAKSFQDLEPVKFTEEIKQRLRKIRNFVSRKRRLGRVNRRLGQINKELPKTADKAARESLRQERDRLFQERIDLRKAQALDDSLFVYYTQPTQLCRRQQRGNRQEKPKDRVQPTPSTLTPR